MLFSTRVHMTLAEHRGEERGCAVTRHHPVCDRIQDIRSVHKLDRITRVPDGVASSGIALVQCPTGHERERHTVDLAMQLHLPSLEAVPVF